MSCTSIKPIKNSIWIDNFDATIMDSTKWSFELGDGCPQLCGWGNNELQIYTDSYENLFIKDGFLHIRATKNNGKYFSAKINTKLKKDIKYGTIEVRAKLPKGLGSWPAIWMLPTEWKYGSWPRSGEIDIMEHVGYLPNKIFGTIHTEDFNHIKWTQKSDSVAVNDCESNFHIYKIRWTPSDMEFFVDNMIYHSFYKKNVNVKEWPFDEKFYLILNIAVGGNWGNKMGIDDTALPYEMEIDYVKIYPYNQN